MQILKMILFILLIILVVIFVLQNPWIIQEEFSLRYFLYETVPLSLSIYLLIVFFFGIILCALGSIVKTSRLKKIIRQQKKKLVQMDKELVSLRNLPITENPKNGALETN